MTFDNQSPNLSLNNIPSPYLLLDSKSTIINSNLLFAKMIGYLPEKLMGGKFDNYLTKISQKKFKSIFTRVKKQETVQNEELDLIHKKESVITVKLNINKSQSSISKAKQFHCILIDITDQRKFIEEHELHNHSIIRLIKSLQSAQNYNEVVDAACREIKAILGFNNLWIYLFTDDKNYANIVSIKGEKSDPITNTENIARLKIKGDTMLEEIASAKNIVIVEDARTDPRTDKKIVKQLGNITIINIPIILMDKHLGSIGTGTFGDEGVRVPTKTEAQYLNIVASNVAVVLDRIKSQEMHRHANNELQKSEEKFRTFVEQSYEGITLIDEAGCIIEWNQANEKITCISADDAIGRPYWDVQFKLILPELKTQERFNRNKKIVKDALKTGKSYLFNQVLESEMIRPDGTHCIVQQTIFPIKTDKGFRIGANTRDITESKKSEVKIHESEQLFRALVENSPDFIARYDREFKRIYVNPAIQKLFKNSDKEILGETPAEQSPINAPDVYIDHLQKVINTAIETSVEISFRTAEGEKHWVHIRFIPEFNQEGHVETVLAIGRDIHEIKESEEKYRTLIQTIQTAVVVHGADTQIMTCNSKSLELLGLTEDQILGKTAIDPDWCFYREDNTIMPIEEYPVNLVMAGKKEIRDYLVGVKHPGKNFIIWCLVNGDPVFDENNKIQQVIINFIDISNRLLAEEALKEREEFLSSIVENIPDMIFIKKAKDLSFVRINKAGEELLGIRRDELIGKSDFDFFPKEHAQFFIENDRKVISDGKMIDVPEEPINTKYGELILHTKKIPIYDKNNKPAYLLGISEDITERKKLEENLRSNEERLELAAEAANMGLWDWNIISGEVLWSDQCKAHYGIPPETEMTYELFLQALHPEDRDQVVASLNRAVEEHTDYNEIKRTIWQDGSIHWTNSRAKVFCNNKGEAVRVVGVTFDITDRIQAEEELKEQMNEINRFNKLMIGREEKMIELKKEINLLLTKDGKPKKYDVSKD